MKMEKKTKDWIKFYRAFKKNPLNRNSFGTHIWLNLLLDAHWNKNDKLIHIKIGRAYKTFTIKRGQVLIKKVSYAEELGMARNTFKKWLSYLEDKDMIRTKSDGNLTLVSIVKYEQYQ